MNPISQSETILKDGRSQLSALMWGKTVAISQVRPANGEKVQALGRISVYEAAGKYQIVHSAIDNAVYNIEVGKLDNVVLSGGDQGMNEFFVQGDVKSFADLRGRILVVDATNTAYAFLLYEILRQNGLKRGTDYEVKAVGASFRRYEAVVQDKSLKAAMLNPPFSLTNTPPHALSFTTPT